MPHARNNLDSRDKADGLLLAIIITGELLHRVVTGYGVLLNIVHCIWRQLFVRQRRMKKGQMGMKVGDREEENRIEKKGDNSK